MDSCDSYNFKEVTSFGNMPRKQGGLFQQTYHTGRKIGFYIMILKQNFIRRNCSIITYYLQSKLGFNPQHAR